MKLHRLFLSVYKILSVPNGLAFKYLDSEDTIKAVTESGKSLIRWGDGESAILNGQNIYFQAYSNNLSNDLEQILKTYSCDSKFILCVPTFYLQKNIFELIFLRRLRSWFNTRFILQKYLKSSRELEFGDAFVFRKMGKDNRLYESLKNYLYYRNVLLVASSRSIYQLIKKFSYSCEWIKIPPKNAYENKHEILGKIEDFIKNEPQKSFTLLVSAGPLAKLIVSHFSKRGIQSIDMGSLAMLNKNDEILLQQTKENLL